MLNPKVLSIVEKSQDCGESSNCDGCDIICDSCVDCDIMCDDCDG